MVVLIPTQLANSLSSSWLPGDNGPWADTEQDSANAFADAVSGWFGQAQAAGFPCSTAAARKSQLASQTLGAIKAGAAPAAGQQLALAFAAYVAGQSFGSGVAAPPIATPAGGAMIGNAFAVLEMETSARANIIAGAIHIMAVSSIVSFPNPPFAAPVM